MMICTLSRYSLMKTVFKTDLVVCTRTLSCTSTIVHFHSLLQSSAEPQIWREGLWLPQLSSETYCKQFSCRPKQENTKTVWRASVCVKSQLSLQPASCRKAHSHCTNILPWIFVHLLQLLYPNNESTWRGREGVSHVWGLSDFLSEKKKKKRPVHWEGREAWSRVNIYFFSPWQLKTQHQPNHGQTSTWMTPADL